MNFVTSPPILAMVAVYHRGMMRGFAIGVLTAGFLGSNGFSAYSIYTLGGSRPSGAFSYLFQRLLMLQFCGMLCACYAAFAELKRDSRDESADS